jgi:DUF4097 and DUF4098 domain-containing protein YvlB
MHTLYLRAITAFAVVALIGLAGPASAETERVTRSVKIGPGATLRLNNFSGRVTITGSNDAAEVAIEATRYGSRSQLENVRLEITSTASGVRIDANRRDRPWSWWGPWGRFDVVETDFDVKVPRNIDLDITLFSATLDVQGVEGSHTVETFSSRVRLDDVNGPIRAKSFSGPLEIRTTAWQATQTVDVETFSGSIDLRVPDSAQGTVEFDSFSGRLKTTTPLTFQSSRRNHIVAQMGAGSGGSIRVKTFSGNLTVDH